MRHAVTHDTFTIERTYDVAPARVFAAFADAKIKARWFQGPPEWGPDEQAMDFRGTKVTFTEHGAYLDGSDNGREREKGTRELLDALGSELQGK